MYFLELTMFEHQVQRKLTTFGMLIHGVFMPKYGSSSYSTLIRERIMHKRYIADESTCCIQSSVFNFAFKQEKKAAKLMHIGKVKAYEITL